MKLEIDPNANVPEELATPLVEKDIREMFPLPASLESQIAESGVVESKQQRKTPAVKSSTTNKTKKKKQFRQQIKELMKEDTAIKKKSKQKAQKRKQIKQQIQDSLEQHMKNGGNSPELTVLGVKEVPAAAAAEQANITRSRLELVHALVRYTDLNPKRKIKFEL